MNHERYKGSKGKVIEENFGGRSSQFHGFRVEILIGLKKRIY